jgi:hypothetical protein
MISIPQGQLCQAFDPMMYLPEKTLHIIEDTSKANTSCVAPAFIYLEGSRGKRFLCDYHYCYEKNMTTSSTPHLWKDIENIILDKRELIKDTFCKNTKTIETYGIKCSMTVSGNHGPSKIYQLGLSCSSDAFVKVTPKFYSFKKYNESILFYDKNKSTYYCNFHFRKYYYRYHSNGVIYEDIFDIVDERYRMTISIDEESKLLSVV